MNAKALLDHAIKSGAPLIAVHRIPLFREFAAKALTEGSCINPLPSLDHDAAVANLERKGFGSKAGPTAKSIFKKSK